MAQCPLCMAQVPDDFGLIECANCSAQLIVHMDGRVEYSGATVSDALTSSFREPSLTKSNGADTEAPFSFGEPMSEIDPKSIFPSVEPTQHGATAHNFGSSNPDEFSPDLEFPPVEEPPALEPEIDPTAEPSEPAPAPEYNFDDEPAVAQPDVSSDSASSDLSDIAHFGNSDASSSRDGSLRYNLMVSGIDTSDVREAFREAITDRKLMWDIDQILRSIKNGEVRVPNVPAAKAFIVVSRLRGLPVQVRWEQYAISQS